MFRRYAITDPRDIKAAIKKREQARAENRHDFSHDLASESKFSANAETLPIN